MIGVIEATKIDLGEVHANVPLVWIVEDDSSTSRRGRSKGRASITTRLHRVRNGVAEVRQAWVHPPGELPFGGRAGLLSEFLSAERIRSGLVVVPTDFATRDVLDVVHERGVQFAIEVRASTYVDVDGDRRPVSDLVGELSWERHVLPAPSPINGSLHLDLAPYPGEVTWYGIPLGLVLVAPGGITDRARNRYCLISGAGVSTADVAAALAWLKWIRALDRKAERYVAPSVAERRAAPLGVEFRPNISHSRANDQAMLSSLEQLELLATPPKTQSSATADIRVVELFAGAGLLGLGFLSAATSDRRYQLAFSGEIDPIAVSTLKRNHSYFSSQVGHDRVAAEVEPLDLASRLARSRIAGLRDVDVLIGGPPCQGFSNANRNSWSPENPNNRLVDVFLGYVRLLKPRVVLLENVQGILWTQPGRTSGTSVGEAVMRQLRRAGYLVFARLLDAVWYGVPQHRTRFFLAAVHRDLGWSEGDFDAWGPLPKPTHGPGTLNPYVTVADAIRDLPAIANGQSEESLAYEEPNVSRNPFLSWARAGSPAGVITDHVTSRHADYVIERYRRIPQGGNWQSVTDLMTNYAGLERTHSNIYRRLNLGEPAITIGHYRKSMIIHPSQHRGLSLREASRLQSIPDWFQFSGTVTGEPGGLMYKQQQLANAVAPLMAKAVAESLARLL